MLRAVCQATPFCSSSNPPAFFPSSALVGGAQSDKQGVSCGRGSVPCPPPLCPSTWPGPSLGGRCQKNGDDSEGVSMVASRLRARLQRHATGIAAVVPAAVMLHSWPIHPFKVVLYPCRHPGTFLYWKYIQSNTMSPSLHASRPRRCRSLSRHCPSSVASIKWCLQRQQENGISKQTNSVQHFFPCFFLFLRFPFLHSLPGSPYTLASRFPSRSVPALPDASPPPRFFLAP